MPIRICKSCKGRGYIEIPCVQCNGKGGIWEYTLYNKQTIKRWVKCDTCRGYGKTRTPCPDNCIHGYVNAS
jgi:DnaJ-class molecular chaperone